MAESSFELSDKARERWLSAASAGQSVAAQPTIDLGALAKDSRVIAREESKVKARRYAIMETWGWKLTDPRSPNRKATARRASKAIRDPADREWLAMRVAEVSGAVGWKKRKGESKKGFMRRFGEKLFELPQAAAEGATDIGESFAGLGRVIGGEDKDAEELQFRHSLESAYQGGDPKGLSDDNVAFKALRGGAKIAPQVATGAAAFRLAGKLGLATQAGAQMYAPARERFVSEGVDPRVATPIAALTAGLGGLIETAVPIPGLGKGGVSAAGTSLATKAAGKLGLTGAKRTAMEVSGRFGAEYVGEAFLEEGLQAAVESMGSLAGAAIEGETAGRSLTEVPSEAYTAAKESALPMLPFSLFGGGFHVAKGIQQKKVRTRIKQLAEEGVAPSRKEWKRLGLAPEQGATRKDRLAGVKKISEAWAAMEETKAAQTRAAEDAPIEIPDIEDAPVTAAQPEVVSGDAKASRLRQFLTEEAGTLPFGAKAQEDVVAEMDESAAREAMKSPSEEVERRRSAGYGLKSPGFWKRIGERVKTMGYSMVRSQIHIPNKPEYSVANEAWRLKQNVPGAAKDEAVRRIASVTAELGPTQLELFERYLLTRNQLRALHMKEPEPLRTGFESIEEVENYERQLVPLVEATPKVKTALNARSAMIRDLATELVENNLLGEEALEDVDSYMHQQVLMYREAFRTGMGRSGKKGFMKKRVKGPEQLGEEYDYNTSYIEPEVAWMSDALRTLEERRIGTILEAKYNNVDEFARQAAEEGKTVRAVAREAGHDLVDKSAILGGKNSASALSNVLTHFEQSVKDDLGMSAEESALSDGVAESDLISLPVEIIKQLEADATTGQPHWLTQISKDMQTAWKAWTLMNPKRIIGYNLRNISGDLDPILAAEPRALLEVANAVRDLKEFSKRGKLSDETRASRDYGVINSGFAGAEVGEIGSGKRFRNPVAAYANIARSGTAFRENILRHAAFLHYLKLVKAGKLSHFGASRRKVVEQVQRYFGDDAAAAHLARNLLGDYGNLSVMGNYLRNHLLPFWSFVEINMTRYPHILANAFRAGKGRTATGAVLSKIAVVRIAKLYGTMWLWNNLLLPAITGDDDEKESASYDRANPHVNMGRNPDGTIRKFRNVGALGDLLEWVGINEAIGLLPKARDGQIDFSDIGKEMLKAPIEKFVGLLRPELKTGFEVLTGKSLFPSPFEPQSIARDEAATNTLGLAEEYKAIKGALTESGESARPHYLQRFLFGVTDPRANALNEIYDLRDSFLAKKGAPEKGTYPISEYRTARQAAINEDKEAFLEWKKAFVKRHGGITSSSPRFFKYLKRVDPISARLNERDEWQFENEYLSNEQREKLRVAREYSFELRDRMLIWWRGGGE